MQVQDFLLVLSMLFATCGVSANANPLHKASMKINDFFMKSTPLNN